MGRDRANPGRALSRIVRVVPDVPSFSVDDGFEYVVPDGITAQLGSIVRVPLGGRRVRGWVVRESEGDAARLKAILGRSGDLPVFDRRTLEVIRWAAVRYVSPLAAILSKATPPNLPRLGARAAPPEPQGSDPGARVATEVWWGPGPWSEIVADAVAPLLEARRSALVVAPTVVEGEVLAGELGKRFGGAVVFASSSDSAAQQTAAWVRAATRSGSVLVGTRSVALWPVRDLGRAFVVGEGRRGMKDKATPATHARELLVRRSQVERFGLVLADLVPSAEALGRGVVHQKPPAVRPWGHVEVVDRRAEDADGALLGPTARSALRAAVKGAQRVLLFTHRRSTAQRCVHCRTVRRCPACGSGGFVEGACARCGSALSECAECGFGRFEMLGAGASRIVAEAGRVVGREHVGQPGSGAMVLVGTERDLPGLEVDQTIVVDGDGPILAPTYRAAEDALRLLGRAIRAAGLGRGRRGLIQTSDPDHPVFTALRRGDPIEFVRTDGAGRARAGFPPGGQVIVVEVTGPSESAGAELSEAVGARGEVLGPADLGDRTRWLIQGADLDPARIALRAVVARWRDGGARVRVDADPLDL